MNERREGLPPRMQGVFTAASFSELLPQHRKIIARVVNEVIRLGIAEFEVERALRGESRDEAHPTRSYLANVYGRQPHQSFLIDGQKGSGKTTLLLNLHRALAQIGPTGCGRHDRSSFPINQLETYASFRGHKLDDFNSCRIAGISRCLVQPLPLIRPDSMEKHETIMESVFAEMTHQLDAEINAVTRTYHDSEFADVPAPRARSSQGTERRAERAKKLRHTLQAEVAKGWYFARALGVEALLSDSMNFDEYIERRAEEAVVSHRRLTNWSSFVIDYLDLFESQMLAIFIDDTDISAELAADILHTIRMYFCHPRIAVLMAGNLHTIRQRLLVRAMGQQAASHESLRTPDSFTARFWRDFERENLEEYLSKVLPRPYRHFIPASSAIPFLAPDAKGTSAKLASSSGEQAPPPQSFVDFCGKQMSKRIASYLRERRTTLQRSQDDARLRWSRYESLVKLANKKNSYHREAENHIALWLLRNHYATQLTPGTARHLNQFSAMIELGPGVDGERGAWRGARRVAVALFTHPNNFAVIQRQSDFDGDASEWINRQSVTSRWRGERWIQVNQLKLAFGTPSYEYLLYRLDLDLSRPTAAWLNPKFPTNLLPEPSGRKIWAPEVWQVEARTAQSDFLGYQQGRKQTWQVCKLPNHKLRLRQEMLGLAAAFSSPVVPANCMYFKDLRPLPDLAWTWDPEGDQDYRRFFDQFPVRNIDNMFRLDRFDPRNDYFRDVVLVFASYPLIQPIPSEEFVRGSTALHLMELSDFDDLFAPSDPKPRTDLEIKRETARFGRIRSLSTLLATRYRMALSGNDRPVRKADARAFRELSPEKLQEPLLAQELFKGPLDPKHVAQRLVSEIIPRYHRILNDVRRAYHAMRILEADINSYTHIALIGPTPEQNTADGAAHGSPDQQSIDESPVVWPKPFNHARNDTYALMDLDKFRALLGLPSIAGDDREDSKIAPYKTRISKRDADTRYWIPLSQPQGGSSPEAQLSSEAQLIQPFSSCVGEILKRATDGDEYHIFAQIAFGAFEPAVWKPSAELKNDQKREADIEERSKRYENSAKYLFTFNRPVRKGEPKSASDIGDILFGERTWELSRGDSPRSATSKDNGFTQVLSPLWHRNYGRRRDPEITESLRKHLFDTRKREDAHCSRMYRSILVTLWGIAPCLSSLVHLTVMGRHYWWQEGSERDKQGVYLANIADDLDDWEVTIAYAMTCVVVLAMALEVNLDADLRELAKSEQGIQNEFKEVVFCAFPDISVAPLGLRMYEVDYLEGAGATNDEQQEDQRKFDGIIGDTLLRLQLTLYYISELRSEFRRVWDEEAYKPPPKKAQSKQPAPSKKRASANNKKKI